MSWPNFLAPWWGLMGLLALPLVALYLLRQKRPDVTISSTLLWSKALADMRASTPFQKLRRNLLLLLQLLILAALVLTLMRPVVQARAGQSRAGVIVIDATASMQTTDDGGPSRLDRAKDEAKKLVDSMRPGDQYMLVVDGGGLNHGGVGFTTSKNELLTEINKIKASDTSSDLFESLLLAATSLRGIGSDTGSATKPRTDALTAGKIWLFSDGAGVRVPDVLGSDANGLLQFVKIGDSDHSVGITSISIQPVAKEPRTYEVFVGLRNAWSQERKIGVALAFGTRDNFLPGQARFATVPPHGQGAVVFEKVVADSGKLFVRLDDAGDDFPLDNTAYGLLEPARKVKTVLVTNGSIVLENFIKTATRVGAMDGQIISTSAYSPNLQADLVILDGFVPPANAMPHEDTLIIRPAVTGSGDVGGFHVSAEVENPAVLRWNRESPVMQYVQLNELRISKALVVDKDPENISLVSSPESDLIAYRDFGSVRRYFVAFSPQVESNWWMQPSLLIFLQNLVDQTRTRHYIGVPQLLASGTPARLWNVGGEKGDGTVRINTPAGTTLEMQAKDGAVEFPATDTAGFYTVTAAGKTSTFAVNLANASESDIRAQSLQTPAGTSVQESTSIATVNKEIWQYLAAAALAILLLEWWIYHRRLA